MGSVARVAQPGQPGCSAPQAASYGRCRGRPRERVRSGRRLDPRRDRSRWAPAPPGPGHWSRSPAWPSPARRTIWPCAQQW